MSASCGKSHHFVYKKQLSKHDDTEHFPIEVHRPETWDLLCKCFVCSNFCLGQISQMDYIFCDAIKFHQIFTGWKWKVCRMTWNKTFAEELQLIENNVCKKYFNSTFHRLIEHLQINILPPCYSPIHCFFPKASLVWPIFQKYTNASWTETLAPSLERAFYLISYAHLHFLYFKIWLLFLHKRVIYRWMKSKIYKILFIIILL